MRSAVFGPVCGSSNKTVNTDAPARRFNSRKYGMEARPVAMASLGQGGANAAPGAPNCSDRGTRPQGAVSFFTPGKPTRFIS
jgi:hypothetical protein